MTPFYALIYILAYSESYIVAQKLSHRHVYLSNNFYNYSYTKSFETPNVDNFQWPIIRFLMQPPFKFHTAADHVQHLFPAPKG